MNNLSDFIDRDFKSNYNSKNLRNYDTQLIAASPAMVLGVTTRSQFRSWNNDFEEKYDQLIEAFRTQGKSINVDYIRNLEVEQRWQAERFFAKEGDKGAREVLGYNATSDGEDVFRRYTQTQWKTLTEGKKRPRLDPQDSSSTIEAHHINDVSNNITVTENGYASTGGPNNLRLMTREAHINSKDLGHGGDSHNPTTGEAKEVDNVFHNVVEKNHSNNIEDIMREGGSAAAAVGAAAIIIQSGYLFFKNRNSHISSTHIIKQGIGAGLKFGSGSLLYTTGFSSITESLHNTKFDYNTESASFAYIPENLVTSLRSDAFADLIAIGGGAGLSKFGYSTWSNISSHGFTSTAFKNIRGESLHVAKQEVGWLGYGLGVDMAINAGVDLGVDVLAGLLIPDPTGVTQIVLIVSRISFGAGKYFYGKHKQKKKYQELQVDLNLFMFEKRDMQRLKILREFDYSMGILSIDFGEKDTIAAVIDTSLSINKLKSIHQVKFNSSNWMNETLPELMKVGEITQFKGMYEKAVISGPFIVNNRDNNIDTKDFFVVKKNVPYDLPEKISELINKPVKIKNDTIAWMRGSIRYQKLINKDIQYPAMTLFLGTGVGLVIAKQETNINEYNIGDKFKGSDFPKLMKVAGINNYKNRPANDVHSILGDSFIDWVIKERLDWDQYRINKEYTKRLIALLNDLNNHDAINNANVKTLFICGKNANLVDNEMLGKEKEKDYNLIYHRKDSLEINPDTIPLIGNLNEPLSYN